jgi:hypothetical protein
MVFVGRPFEIIVFLYLGRSLKIVPRRNNCVIKCKRKHIFELNRTNLYFSQQNCSYSIKLNENQIRLTKILVMNYIIQATYERAENKSSRDHLSIAFVVFPCDNQKGLHYQASHCKGHS